MNSLGLSLNPSSNKTRFAHFFLRALTRIKMDAPTLPSLATKRRCSRRIKLAADASMAFAVGSRRSWSRAMLLKLRRRARHRAFLRKKMVGTKKKKKKRDVGNDMREELSRTDELRRLVPGGEDMGLCSLLEETAHYMKCLNTQVEVMKSVVDFYSS